MSSDDEDETRDAEADLDTGVGDGGEAGLADATDGGGGESETKLCRYCYSEIDGASKRCCRCGGDLRFIEKTDIKQNWTMLFLCVSVFVSCIWLPIERHDGHFLYPSHSFSGGFLTIFAAYGMLASYANILQRKAIYWPMLFMAFDGLYHAITRYISLFKQIPEGAEARDYILMGGPALPIILFCSLMTLWTFMKGAASGRAKDKAVKDAARRR